MINDRGSGLPSDVLVPTESLSSDPRGEIISLVERPMRSALLIRSHAGAVRGDHYHKTDWHFCYVLTGSLDYLHRPAGSTISPERVRIAAGQLFFTPPMVEHAMIFLEETEFITFGGNPRDPASYERDLVRVQLPL